MGGSTEIQIITDQTCITEEADRGPTIGAAFRPPEAEQAREAAEWARKTLRRTRTNTTIRAKTPSIKTIKAITGIQKFTTNQIITILRATTTRIEVDRPDSKTSRTWAEAIARLSTAASNSKARTSTAASTRTTKISARPLPRD